MQSTIGYRNPSIINAYTFEIIPKGEYTKRVIENFDHLERIEQLPFKTTAHVGIYDFSIKLKQWKITNVRESIESVENDNTNILLKRSFQILKNATTEMEISVWEPDFLPFNYMILSIHLDSKKLDLKNSYQTLYQLLRPFATYWKSFGGIISSEYEKGFSFPSFFQIIYETKSVKSELQKILEDLQKYSNDKLDIKKYVEYSNKLKQFFRLEDLDYYYNLISLLKIQDGFFMLGNLGVHESDFATVFSLEPNEFTYTGSNPFFANTIMSFSFGSLFFPYLIVVTPIFWLRFNRRRLIEVLDKINKFKTTYKTEDYLKQNSEDALSKILAIDNDLNFMLSELNDLKITNRIFNNYFIKNPEIIDKSIVTARTTNLKENLIKNKIISSYLVSCNLSFKEQFSEIETYVKELQNDVSFIKKRIEFLQNERDYKIKVKQNKILLIFGGLSGSFAVVVGIDVIIRWFFLRQ